MELSKRDRRLIVTALKYFRQEEELIPEMESLMERFGDRPLVGRGSAPTRLDQVVECLTSANGTGITAKEVSEAVDMSQTQAGIYLKHLVDVGKATRERGSHTGHRRNAWVYHGCK